MCVAFSSRPAGTVFHANDASDGQTEKFILTGGLFLGLENGQERASFPFEQPAFFRDNFALLGYWSTSRWSSDHCHRDFRPVPRHLMHVELTGTDGDSATCTCSLSTAP